MAGAAQRALFPALLAMAAALIAWAVPARAVILADLNINATERPYGPGAPVISQQQAFSVPSGPGTLVMTYTEEPYVGGAGGFDLQPRDLSPERLGFGGGAEYTPRSPIKGQPYRVRTTWLHDFSKKVWVATLTARHEYQAYQVRDRGQQHASRMRLVIEFLPGGGEPQGGPAQPSGGRALTGSWDWGVGGGVVEIYPDGTGHDGRGNTMRWSVRNAAAGVYELRWSHGYTDTANVSEDGRTVSIVNNAGTRFTATRRAAAPVVTPPPATPNRLVGAWNWGAGGGVVEIFADGSGHDSRGNSMRWSLRDAASRTYELRWSHGYTDTAVLSADGTSVSIVNNAGTRFTATRR